MRRILKCGGTDQKISVSQVPSAFDLQDLIEIDHGFYCLANENAQQATKDLIYLNDFIDVAAKICPEFQAFRINIEDIRFEYNPDATPRNYAILKIEPITPSGKPPKFPVCLSFCGIHIYYAQNKQIQKVRIIAWKGCPYELNLAMHNGELAVHSIYKTSMIDFKKNKLYEHPKD